MHPIDSIEILGTVSNYDNGRCGSRASIRYGINLSVSVAVVGVSPVP